MISKGNIDLKTVDGFGDEWTAFDQASMAEEEWRRHFAGYFSVFPFDALPDKAEGFDLGCGSGRWARGIAPQVGMLHCIDPSHKALEVTRRILAEQPNVVFHCASVDSIPLADDSQDFGYSLGVLHHIPDTAAAIKSCVAKLKPGAPFLIYLYYAFDNRPTWFRSAWRASDVLRRGISRLPFVVRRRITDVMAASVYWPLTRAALIADRLGLKSHNVPLSAYRNYSFYTMRTDALDRFGTRLERRFTRVEITHMMKAAALEEITFRDEAPYWVACGRKRR